MTTSVSLVFKTLKLLPKRDLGLVKICFKKKDFSKRNGLIEIR